MSSSQTSRRMNLDGRPSGLGPGDQVTISFGTAQISGGFVRERVCLGPAHPAESEGAPCAAAHVVTATSMSERPFAEFQFDGILGLGLPALALSRNHSLFGLLVQGEQVKLPHFGLYLTESDDGEGSEIAIGGHNPNHLMEALSWVPLSSPELGYWQVHIDTIQIGGTTLDICRRGTCRGIVDSGTSHLGVPSSIGDMIEGMLTVPGGTATNCHEVDAPVVIIGLRGLNLTLHPRNYMRELPLPMGVRVSATIAVPAGPGVPRTPRGRRLRGAGPPEQATGAAGSRCTPKLLPLSWPQPIGPDVFILGEPLLQRYYTVFDWSGLRMGFGRAARRASPRRNSWMRF